MLNKKHFLTKQGLSDLLSVATYGNEWPVIKAFKSDAEKGLFDNCDCCEDKWATALLKGKGVVVYDLYDEDAEDFDGDISTFPETAKHPLTIENVKKGLDVMRDKYPRHWADLVEENDDLITGDVWLQCAVFGELVYG
jgi:hypothetical protein